MNLSDRAMNKSEQEKTEQAKKTEQERQDEDKMKANRITIVI